MPVFFVFFAWSTSILSILYNILIKSFFLIYIVCTVMKTVMKLQR